MHQRTFASIFFVHKAKGPIYIGYLLFTVIPGICFLRLIFVVNSYYICIKIGNSRICSDFDPNLIRV
jgi:hypothetical protein